MFGGGSTNPYDEVVTNTTDENLTSENWELILNLCDKVQEEGQEGARNVMAAVLKRLAHRNPNVQLYALSLSESLSKNCSIELHREIASRAFTQGLEKLITDRTTHEKVRRRALGLIAMWTAEFESDSTLGVMEDCYNSLQAKNYKFETPQEPPPPTVDDEIRRKEEEELQRVLEISMEDKGGRDQWARYNDVVSSSAGGSGSSPSLPWASGSSSSYQAPSSSYAIPSYSSGYAPARTPSPKQQVQQFGTAPVSSTPATVSPPQTNIVTRVRALHTFEPTEPGELGFEKGDIIKVVDRGYKDWWRGQLKGRTGIFPVNYVEAMPEPTAAELGKEAEQEAAVFAQAVNVEKLLNMLRSLDPAKDNLADNEEIQELYRSSMALRPKIVKLIDKYSQKRADLVSMNETFVRARTIFDRMMEESLARHSAMYEQPPTAAYQPTSQFSATRPDSRGQTAPASYTWNQQPQQHAYGTYPQYAGPYGPQSQSVATAYGPQPYGPQGPLPYLVQGQGQSGSPPAQVVAAQTPQNSIPAQAQGAMSNQTQGSMPSDSQGALSAQVQGALPTQAQSYMSTKTQGHVPAQAQAAQVLGQAARQADQATQPQSQAQVQHQQQIHGRQVAAPYVYDPTVTYSDPNVQAWAQYYAKGGKDPAGGVYFISVPGVTDNLPPPATPAPEPESQPLQHKSQHQMQTNEYGSVETLSSPFPTRDQQQQPVIESEGGRSPVATSSTPSWVLPKMSSPPKPAVGAGSPAPGGAEMDGGYGRSPYYSLSGHMAGISISGDQTQGSAHGYQGVGATA
ncbi:uncharacterized protein BT62DRAFT_980645 [Guyanagaster necrorhizus]|uniref:Class E vacuolar protein-sorting machinery protein HSE1 n=1 Tax=Guyanagaster necrorhizus TaxID=856835 RepID=A0A9P7VTX8_9AGAR|nr:uncharacterized protein BT62DRAFT_980645 [Guyanagaster necrorhizus MCA 3950]KAG7446385.1 hypothetical protein BT62DRAFT_980645 [Guyanagaster necrorhizus MCA 3950]